MASVSIEGREYDPDKLSEQARQLLTSVNVVDQEIRRLQAQLAIFQTARRAYVTALQQALPKE